MGVSQSKQKKNTTVGVIAAKKTHEHAKGAMFMSAEDLFTSLTQSKEEEDEKKDDDDAHHDDDDDDDYDDDDDDDAWQLDEQEELFFSHDSHVGNKKKKQAAKVDLAATPSVVTAAVSDTAQPAKSSRAAPGAFSVTLHEVALFQLQVLGSVAELIGFSLETTWLLLEASAWDRDRLVEELFSDKPDAAAKLALEAGAFLAAEPLPPAVANQQLLRFEAVLGDPKFLGDASRPKAPGSVPSGHGAGALFRGMGIVFGHRLALELLYFCPDESTIIHILTNKLYDRLPDYIVKHCDTQDEYFGSENLNRSASPWLDQLAARKAVAEAEKAEQSKVALAIARAAPIIDKTDGPAMKTMNLEASLYEPMPEDADYHNMVLEASGYNLFELMDAIDKSEKAGDGGGGGIGGDVAAAAGAHRDDDDDDDAGALRRKANVQTSLSSAYSIVVHANDIVASPIELGGGDAGAADGEVECSICFSDVPRSESFALRCEHRFCKSCYGSHLTAILSNGKLLARCMQAGCKVALSPLAWFDLLDAQQFSRYRRLSLQSFVDRSPVSAFCSNPTGCERVVFWPRVLQATSTALIECQCGHRMCWGCLAAPHAPASCAQVKEFTSASGVAADALWIARNTKPCPRCKVSIEKNEGCMHMTCQNAGCGYEFCWLCLQSWSGHASYYECSRPKAALMGRTDKVAQTVERHEFHKQAADAVRKRRIVFEIIAFRLQRESLPGARLLEAHSLAIRCHELLAWSEVLSLSIEFDVHAQLLSELLHNLRIHTDRVWAHALRITNGEDNDKPVQQRAVALNALHAASSVVERHRVALCEALDSGVAFESVGGASLSKAARKVASDAAPAPSIPSASAPARAAQRVMGTRPLMALRQLGRRGDDMRSSMQIVRIDQLQDQSAQLYDMVEEQQQQDQEQQQNWQQQQEWNPHDEAQFW